MGMSENEYVGKYFKRVKEMEIPSVILIDPKYPHNVGQSFRMAVDYCVGQVWASGERILTAVETMGRIPREERVRSYQNTTLTWDENPVLRIPKDAIPVAIELVPGAENLFDFDHPEKAIYIFGPEDGSLPGSVLSRCHRIVAIDSMHCLNLAGAVGTVLYDRALKEHVRRRGAFMNHPLPDLQ